MAGALIKSAEHLASLPVPLGDTGLVSVAKICEAVKQIVRLINPVRVTAFGSRARGDHEPESDLDLAVVVDRYDPNHDARPIWRSQIAVLMPIDLVVYDVARERERTGALNTLQGIVAREGRVLFERSTGIIDEAAIENLV